MPSDQHNSLVKLGEKWMRRQGFSVTATEITSVGSRERPDVIAFRAGCSAIIEVKVSRSDFLADAKKTERQTPELGLGNYRFYLCPMGLIKPEELPPKWGLLGADGVKIHELVRPQGNIWPSVSENNFGGDAWAQFQHVSDINKERAILFSIARQLTKVR